MCDTFFIRGREIGANNPTYIIAEIGINHNGDVDLAKEMIVSAKKCGVNAIKFQIFKTEDFVSNYNDTYSYISQGKSVTESMFSLFKRVELDKESWIEIFSFCHEQNIDAFATPQNESDLEFLLTLTDVPVIKVGSDDLTNLELLKSFARKGKPLIISAGMAYISEIDFALRAIRETGNEQVAVLHCTSSYPCNPEDVHLNKIRTIHQAFNVITGFSDHTVGSMAAIGAVVLGASIIEKHFTIDKNLPGPDHWFSADPKDMSDLVYSIRYIEKAMGQPVIQPTPLELEMRKIARRSIVASTDIHRGQVIERRHMNLKRPGTGLSPQNIEFIIGKKALCDIKKNEQITFENIC